MRLFIIINLILICLTTNGQETKKIIKYFYKSKQIMEEYEVLKNNEKIRHGIYVKYYHTYNNDYELNKEHYIQKHGYYFQNQLDSCWTFYDNGFQIQKKEFYSKGVKTGIWQTYIENGRVIKLFDFNNNNEIEPIINYNYIYPDIAQEKGIEGIVEIYVKYNPDCKIDTIYVKKSVDKFLDRGALNNVIEYERLRQTYSLKKNCIDKIDTTYILNYELR